MAYTVPLGLWTQPYVDFRSPADVRPLVERAAAAGVTMLFPCVKSEPHFTGGRAYALFTTQDLAPYFTWDALAALCAAAEGTGIEVHPWLCCFHEGPSEFLTAYPECACYAFDYLNRQTPTTFSCPAQERVQDYVVGLAQQILARYPVRGLHLDFVRFPSAHTCACDHCRALLRRETGAELEGVWHDLGVRAAWVEQRRAIISGLVSRLAAETHAASRPLSAAVFAGYPACLADVGQDWAAWTAEGLLDRVVPMTYTADVESFRRQALHHRLLLGPERRERLMEGIGRRTETVWLPPDDLLRQVEGAAQLGAGAVLFSYAGLTDADAGALAALRATWAGTR